MAHALTSAPSTGVDLDKETEALTSSRGSLLVPGDRRKTRTLTRLLHDGPRSKGAWKPLGSRLFGVAFALTVMAIVLRRYAVCMRAQSMLADFRGSENSPSIPRAGVFGSGARLRRLAEGGGDKESEEPSASAECVTSALASLTLGSTSEEAGDVAPRDGGRTPTMQVATGRTQSRGLQDALVSAELGRHQSLLLNAIREECSRVAAQSSGMAAAVVKIQESLEEVLMRAADQHRSSRERLVDLLGVGFELLTRVEVSLLESERQILLEDLEEAGASGVEDASLAPAALLSQVEKCLQGEELMLASLQDTLQSSFARGPATWENVAKGLLRREEQRATARLQRRTQRLHDLIKLSQTRSRNAEEQLKDAKGEEAKKLLYTLGDMNNDIGLYQQQLSLCERAGKVPASPLGGQLADSSSLIFVILKNQPTEEKPPPKPWESIERAIQDLTNKISREHAFILYAVSSGGKRAPGQRKAKLLHLLRQREQLQRVLKQARGEGTDA
nr:TPA: hypothetical protein BN1205_031450 [Toxoplasma gondii VEG]